MAIAKCKYIVSFIALLLFSCSIDFNNGREALRKNDLRAALGHLQKVTQKDKHYAETIRLIDSVNIEIRRGDLSSSLRDYIFSVYGAGDKAYGDIDRQWSFPATKIDNIRVSILSSGISGSADINYGVHFDGSYEFTKGYFIFDTLRNSWFERAKYQAMLENIAKDSADSAVERYVAKQAKDGECSEYAAARKVRYGDLNNDGQKDVAVQFTLEGCGGGGNNFGSFIAVFINNRDRYSFLKDTVAAGNLSETTADLSSIRGGAIILNISCGFHAENCDSSMVGEREWFVTPRPTIAQEARSAPTSESSTSSYVDEDCVRGMMSGGLSRDRAIGMCSGSNLQKVKDIQRMMNQ